jgi:hypothetical protein
VKRKKGVPYVVGFDSEDDGKGNPFLWSFVHERGIATHESRFSALSWLGSLSRDQRHRNRYVECWCTNLEYDLVNLFDPDSISQVQLRFGRNALCGAKWSGVEFRDTLRHVPISVEAWGPLVGIAKRHAGMFQRGRGNRRPTMAQFRERCERDATITYRAAKFLRSTYKLLKTEPGMTLASTALKTWRVHHWKREVRRPAIETWNVALEAYHGGRTQAFRVGSFKQVRAIDVASMFPWAMTSGELPLPWGLTRPISRGEDLVPYALYDVIIESRVEFPCLPVRTKTGTIYPNGRWRGWYVGEELLTARALGVRIKVLGGIQFSEVCSPFSSYVREMFRRKQRSRGGPRLMFKLLLNALYGKFGQQGKRVEAVPIEKLLTMREPPLEWRPWCGLAIFTKEGLPPPHGNNVWSAWITARARSRLALEIDRLRRSGATILYCDTDSVLFQGRGRYPSKARRVGDFEHRGDFSECLIIGKKEYALRLTKKKWEVHAKGVPFSERMSYLRHGRATFARPVRIRESSRIDVPANVWRNVTKVRRTNLAERAGRGGVLPVPVVNFA